jgi:hypothetical protein
MMKGERKAADEYLDLISNKNGVGPPLQPQDVSVTRPLLQNQEYILILSKPFVPKLLIFAAFLHFI